MQSKLPPLPLPEMVEEQLSVGLKAIDALQDVLAVTVHDNSFDRPWLPAHIRQKIVDILIEAENLT